MSLLSGSQPSPPSPPPFNPINVSNIANSALNQDISRYGSYTFPVFPGMTSVLNNEIQNAYQQLTSPLSSDFSNTFMRNATVTDQSSIGGGDPLSGMAYTDGSLAKGAQSASFTRQDLAKQDYDRANFESLLSEEPVPGLGLSQQDLLSMYVYNTGAQNAYNMGNYTNSIAQANASYAAQQANYGAIGNLISGLGNTYAQYQMYNNQFGGLGGGIDNSNSLYGLSFFGG